MNILIVAPDFPFPPNHGGRADVWKRIQLLHEEGHDIDLLCTVEPSDVAVDDLAQARQVVRNVYFSPRRSSWRAALGFKPYQVSSRASLREFKPAAGYRAVIFESEFVGEAMMAFRGYGVRQILRVHNNEVAYFRALFASSSKFHHKLYYFSEALKFAFYSSLAKRRSDVILHISHSEYAADVDSGLGEKVVFFPPHVNAHQMVPPRSEGNLRACFVGNLFTDNNVAGLKWYLDRVHPLVLRELPGYQLVVAGNSRGNTPGFLKEAGSSVIFHESPERLDGIYASCTVFVNPMQSGAGVKLKTINAIESGLPVVSTNVGAEGIGIRDGEHYLLRDEPQEFAAAVVALLKDSARCMALTLAAQSYLSTHFDNARKINGVLSGAADRSVS